MNQEEHLKQVIEGQRALTREISELSELLRSKQDTALKLQGIIEYLTQIGVGVSDTPPTEFTEDVTKED
jgi:translation initiation factor 2B subunit (eIF-2B alpha/beta/delta family)